MGLVVVYVREGAPLPVKVVVKELVKQYVLEPVSVLVRVLALKVARVIVVTHANHLIITHIKCLKYQVSSCFCEDTLINTIIYSKMLRTQYILLSISLS